MRRKAIPLLLLFAAALGSCENKQALNPPADGFDMANSDPKAVELADSVMNAMGGRKNWDKTRYISWNFFGGRNLIWDKHDNRVRIESLRDSIIYLVDLDQLQGRVSVKGQEITEPDSLSKMIKKGRSMWINDSYWLLMPFKLKDSGLTIKYIGKDTLPSGGECDVLELTFKDIGDTPQNKYRIFVDNHDNLVKQWAYYSNATQDSANFTRPWDNYQKYGDILISADRSDGAGPKDVKVDETLPETTFTEF